VKKKREKKVNQFMAVAIHKSQEKNQNQDEFNDSELLTLQKNVKRIIISDKKDKGNEIPLKSSQLTIKLQEQPNSQKTIDPFDFIPTKLFSTEKFNQLVSPRSSHIIFTKNDVFDIFQYTGMMQWLNNNVAEFMKNKERWSRHVYPERLLYVYGPRGMGRLTRTLIFCHEKKINFMFVPSSVQGITDPCLILKRAKEIQPCIIYFDDADVMFSHKPFLDVIYATSNSLLNKRDDNVWMIFTSIITPEDLCPMARSMIREYGSMTDVNAIESSEQAKALIMKMLATMTRSIDYPCTMSESEDRYSRWYNIITLLSKYTQYCTIKELEGFFIQLFRSHHQSFSSHNDKDTFPTSETFEIAMDNLPYLDDRSDLRTLTTIRNPVSDYKAHEQHWSFYMASSGIKSTPRPSPSSPGSSQQFLQKSQPHSHPHTPVAPQPLLSREQQREAERTRRYQMRMQAETENLFHEEFNLAELPMPPPPPVPYSQASSSAYCPLSSPSQTVFDNREYFLPSNTTITPPTSDKLVTEQSPPPRPTTTPLPSLPPLETITKKRPSTPILTSPREEKETPVTSVPSDSFWKRLRRN
jgi:hypothetical protein